MSGGGAAHAKAVLMIRNEIKTNDRNLMFFPFSCVKIDDLVKSYQKDGTEKSSRCKARESLGMRRTWKYVVMTKDEAQRSPSAMLRAASLSSGRWTFYEAVNVNIKYLNTQCFYDISDII